MDVDVGLLRTARVLLGDWKQQIPSLQKYLQDLRKYLGTSPPEVGRVVMLEGTQGSGSPVHHLASCIEVAPGLVFFAWQENEKDFTQTFDPVFSGFLIKPRVAALRCPRQTWTVALLIKFGWGESVEILHEPGLISYTELHRKRKLGLESSVYVIPEPLWQHAQPQLQSMLS